MEYEKENNHTYIIYKLERIETLLFKLSEKIKKLEDKTYWYSLNSLIIALSVIVALLLLSL